MEESANSSPEVITSHLSSRSSFSYIKAHRRIQCLLIGLAIIIIIAMVVGIAFVAHYYYHSWGGQGFLWARYPLETLQGSRRPRSHLPFLQMARPTPQICKSDYTRIKRSPEIPPFYLCGDQENSCGAWGGPVSLITLTLSHECADFWQHTEHLLSCWHDLPSHYI